MAHCLSSHYTCIPLYESISTQSVNVLLMRGYRFLQKKKMRPTQLKTDIALPMYVMTVRASRWRTGLGCSSWMNHKRN